MSWIKRNMSATVMIMCSMVALIFATLSLVIHVVRHSNFTGPVLVLVVGMWMLREGMLKKAAVGK